MTVVVRAETISHQGYVVVVAECDAEPKLRYAIHSGQVSPAEGAAPAPMADGDLYGEITFPTDVRIAGASTITLRGQVDDSAFTTWTILSDDQHVYLFRSIHDCLYANRYRIPAGSVVEDQPRLVPHYEARFQASGLRATPAGVDDVPSIVDDSGAPFEEPTMVFPELRPRNGHFGVVLTPSELPGRRRWLFICEQPPPSASPAPPRFQVVSYLRAQGGWMDSRGGDASGASRFELQTGAAGSFDLQSRLECLTYRPQDTFVGRDGKTHKLATPPRLLLASAASIPATSGSAAQSSLLVLEFPLDPETGVPAIPPHVDVPRLPEPNDFSLYLDGPSTSASGVRPDAGNGSQTVELWLRPTEASATGVWVELGAGTEEWLALSVESGELVLSRGGATPFTFRSHYRLEPSWTHVAVVSKPSEASLYVNGRRRASFVTTSPLLPPGAGSVTLGASRHPDLETVFGETSELRLWTVARSSGQLRTAMYQRLSAGSDGLVACWPLDDGSGPSARGGGSALALSGARWVNEHPPIGEPPETSTMGLLEWVPAETVPSLVDGGDGRIHCYTTVGGRPAVALFNTDSTRTRYELLHTNDASLDVAGQKSAVIDFIPRSPELGSTLTVELWVRSQRAEGSQSILHATSGSLSIALHEGIPAARLSTAAGDVEVQASSAVVVGEWTHLALTASEQGDVRLLVNGVEAGRVPRPRGGDGRPAPLATFGPGLSLGMRMENQPVDFLEGELNEIRLWSSAATDVTLASRRTRQLSVGECQADDLLGYWMCDAGFGTVLADSSKNGHSGQCEAWSRITSAPISRRVRTTLELAAKDAGLASNHLSIRAKAAPGFGSSTSPAEFLDVEIKESGTIVETWKGVPSNVADMRQIVNGQACTDPGAPEVQRGDLPFYDYSGTHSVLRLAADGGGHLALVSASSAPARLSAARFSDSRTSPERPGVLTMDFQVRERQPSMNGLQPRLGRWPCQLIINDLGLAAEAVIDVLRGTAEGRGYDYEHSMTWTAATSSWPSGDGYVVFICSSVDLIQSISVRDSSPADRCSVTIRTEFRTATWDGVARDPKRLLQQLNLTGTDHDFSLEGDWPEVASQFIAVAVEATEPIRNGDLPAPARESFARRGGSLISSLFSLTSSAATGMLRPQRALIVAQGFEQTPARPERNAGSAILHAIAPGSAGDDQERVRPGTAALVHQGSRSSWAANVTSFSITLGDQQVAAARVAGRPAALWDFTAEAWIKPGQQLEPSETILACSRQTPEQGFRLRLQRDENRSRLQAMAGSRAVGADIELGESPSWSHVAATCRGSWALEFHGTEYGRVAKSELIRPGEVFSIDGYLRWEGGADGTIISKTSGAKASFVLSIEKLEHDTQKAQICLEVLLGDRDEPAAHCTVKIAAKEEVRAGEDYYFAAGATRVGSDEGEKRDVADFFAVAAALSDRGTRPELLVRPKVLEAPNQLLVPKDQPKGAVRIYRLGSSWEFLDCSDVPVVVGARVTDVRGRSSSSDGFRGQLGALRYWESFIAHETPALFGSPDVPASSDQGPLANWTMNEGAGRTLHDADAEHPISLTSSSMWVRSRLSASMSLFVDGTELVAAPIEGSAAAGDHHVVEAVTMGGVLTYDGGSATNPRLSVSESYRGSLDGVRLWSTPKSEAEIRDGRYHALPDDTDGLAGSWPILRGTGEFVADHSGGACPVELRDVGAHPLHLHDLFNTKPTGGDAFWEHSSAPVGDESPAIRVLPDRATEHTLTDMRSVGAVEYPILEQRERGAPLATLRRGYVFVGVDGTVLVERGHLVGKLETEYVGHAQTRPTLVGFVEGAPPIPSENLTRPLHLHPTAIFYLGYDRATTIRLVEANETLHLYSAQRDRGFDTSMHAAVGMYWGLKFRVGMGFSSEYFNALSKVGVASRIDLALGTAGGAERSVRITSGQTNQMESFGAWERGEPLNGLVGRRYLHDNVGYALLQCSQVEVRALRLKRTGTLLGLRYLPTGRGPDTSIVIFPIQPTYTKQGTLDGKVGFVRDPDFPASRGSGASYFRPNEAYALEDQLEADEADLRSAYEAFRAGRIARDVKVAAKDHPSKDPDSALEEAQELAYDWEARRPRRNLVNSYIWTAPGGLFAQEERTAVSRETSEGGGYSFKSLAGLDADFALNVMGYGFYAHPQLLYGGHVHTTVTKAKRESDDLRLEVDVNPEGYLERYVAPPDTSPLGAIGRYERGPTPGKVLSYRFKSFYLAPHEDSFATFFRTVVDQAWLATSKSAEATALRTARQAGPGEVWRVMHRVTEVNRVPPDTTGAPQDEAVPRRRGVINLDENSSLLALAEDLQRLRDRDEAARRERIAEEVRSLVSEELERVPWGPAFMEAAAEAASEAALQYEEILRSTRWYVSTRVARLLEDAPD